LTMVPFDRPRTISY